MPQNLEIVDLMAANGKLMDSNRKLQIALEAARSQLVTIGGDSSSLRTKAEAMECSVDMIQWHLLHLIDDALASV